MKCQNCNNEFIIEEQDQAFYKRMSVPEPTFCPQCRMQRRLTYRNERILYKRKCDLCNKDTFSIYSLDSPYTIYCLKCFYSDDWNPLKYGREYDWNKPFFEQFKELMIETPKLSAQKSNDNENCDYVNHVAESKNCYLMFASVNNENSLYGTHVSYSKDIVDGYRVFKSEVCYECLDCYNSYNLKYSFQCQQCNDSWFLYNCRSCSDCFSCSNLIHKSYCINNKQYTKEEYMKKIKEFETGDRKFIENKIKEFDLLKEQTIRRAIEGFNNTNSIGNYMKNTKNCIQCFDISDAEDCKYVVYCNNSKDIMDGFGIYPVSESCYEVVGTGEGAYNCMFTFLPWDQASDLAYCINAFPGCKSCFGCTQIRNNEYCILNKQYTKQEYENMLPKIKKHMDDMPYTDKKGRVYRYGEFFPPELSPFAYNETVAQEYFPLTKEQSIEQGYAWRDSIDRDLKIDISVNQIPDNIKDVQDDIVNKVIECEHKGSCNEQCTTAFKIIPQELEFYRKMNIPLPKLCSNCRHYQRIKQRNPLKLWKRQCAKCKADIQTTYEPSRPEIVYCEKCYQQEVL